MLPGAANQCGSLRIVKRPRFLFNRRFNRRVELLALRLFSLATLKAVISAGSADLTRFPLRVKILQLALRYAFTGLFIVGRVLFIHVQTNAGRLEPLPGYQRAGLRVFPAVTGFRIKIGKDSLGCRHIRFILRALNLISSLTYSCTQTCDCVTYLPDIADTDAGRICLRRNVTKITRWNSHGYLLPAFFQPLYAVPPALSTELPALM